MKLVVFVPETGRLPKGYGVAYVEWNQLGAVCMPVPLNLIAGACRKAWHQIRVGLKPSMLDAARTEGWQAGYAQASAIPPVIPREVRREAFIEGFQYFKDDCLADLNKTARPQLPEYMQ